jgi:DNA mismatch repair protein MSH3
LNSSVRVERIDKIPDFETALDHLTKFYSAPRSLKSGEIDMTGDSDEEQSKESEIDANPMDLAAGLPSESAYQHVLIFAAEAAVLALVDFPKQVVVALSVAVRYMKCEVVSR